jgi:hypothetical protein
MELSAIGMSMVRLTALGFAFIAAANALACTDAAVLAPGVTAAELCARQDSLVANESSLPTINEIFDTMARLLPGGFAGLAADGWYLQTPALADTARRTAAVLAACPRAQAPNLWAIVQTTPAHGVSYSWLQLSDWYQRLLGAGSIDGLVSAGIDVLHNAIDLSVRGQQDVDTFRARARDLEIPDDALALSIDQPPAPRISERRSNER